MRHGDIWRGLDELAARHGLSTSGLAKRAGLDATAFNKSKRTAKDGRPRWPSTESLSMALAAVGADLIDFAMLVTGRAGSGLPVLKLHDVALEGVLTTDGTLNTKALGEQYQTMRGIEPDAFVLNVTSDAFAPAYQIGDRLIVSPDAEIAVGDHALLKFNSGPLIIGRRRAPASLGESSGWDNLSNKADIIEDANLVWASRILWLGQ